MPTPRLIVCEKTSRWAVAFRRGLGKRMPLVLETRSLEECRRELAASPASVAAIEATEANLDAAIMAISQWSREFPLARLIGLLNEGSEPASLALREAGAILVVDSARQASASSRLVLRHLALAPPEELPLRASIYARLPWRGWATLEH